MKLHRFYIGPTDWADTLIIDAPDLIHQIRVVLRLRAGEEAILFDGVGSEARVRIEDIEARAVRVGVIMREAKRDLVNRAVTLYCAILKRDNFELVTQKAVELGVARIVPVMSERVIKQNINRGRLRKIIVEAAEQSGRQIIPQLGETLDFESALADAKAQGAVAFFDQSGEPWLSVRGESVFASVVAGFIGPEGGWTEVEQTVARATGCAAISLGPTTLRAETAAIVATFVLLT